MHAFLQRDDHGTDGVHTNIDAGASDGATDNDGGLHAILGGAARGRDAT